MQRSAFTLGNLKSYIMQAVILLLLLSLGNVSCEFYHITPSPSVPCTDSESIPCLTLSQFLNDASTHNTSSNTTLIFLSGNHSFDADLSVDNANAFSMLSISTSSPGTVLILCSYLRAFKFENISSVHISGLAFYGCIDNTIIAVDRFFLEDSNFIGRSGEEGAPLELINTTTTLIRTSFQYNIANKLYDIDCPQYQKQGQAQAGGAIVSIKSNITILHSIFEGNSAVAGGAIFYTNCDVTVIIPYCSNNIGGCESRFRKEITRDSHERGLNDLASNQINITHCKFINNYVIKNYAMDPGVGGGAVFAVAANVAFIHNEFLNNTVLHYSGGVVYTNIANILILNTTFVNNSVHSHSGGILLAYELANVTIAHSHFINNSAPMGGIVKLENNFYATATITHSHFSNNSASVGGVITVDVIDYSKIKVSISHSEFIDNFAKSLGGVINIGGSPLALRYEECVNVLHIIHSRFINNNVRTGSGGAIYAEDCPTFMKVIESEFIESNCSSEGGVLAVHENRDIHIIQNEFMNNRAQSAGIAYINSGRVLIAENNFVKNIATSFGGVMVIESSTIIKIVNNLFIENHATLGHGGVMATDSSLKFEEGNIKFWSRSTVYVDSNKFVNNSAETNGGVSSK